MTYSWLKQPVCVITATGTINSITGPFNDRSNKLNLCHTDRVRINIYYNRFAYVWFLNDGSNKLDIWHTDTATDKLKS
jgi:hypothetical protein